MFDDVGPTMWHPFEQALRHKALFYSFFTAIDFENFKMNVILFPTAKKVLSYNLA